MVLLFVTSRHRCAHHWSFHVFVMTRTGLANVAHVSSSPRHGNNFFGALGRIHTSGIRFQSKDNSGYDLPPSLSPFCLLQVGITLRNASKSAQPLPTLILKALDEKQGGGFGWTSYDTGLVEGPFRPEHVKVTSLTHTLAVTGKVLTAAVEEFPSFSKDLQYIKVCILWPVHMPKC